MADSFFVPDGERWLPTDWARGPWSADAAHAGPPAALLGRAVEALGPAGPEMPVSRFTMDILRPIPIRPLSVRAEVVRPGRRVQLSRATLSDGGDEIARASVWRIRPSPTLEEEIALEAPDLQAPLDAPVADLLRLSWEPNYFDAFEWRTARGEWLQPGPAGMWMRLRVTLVPGEEPSPLTRVLAAADSANGISWAVPFGQFVFTNVDLSVHVARMPEGEWVCVDAETRIGRDGLGLAQSRLWDERGRFGAGAQSLLVYAV